MVTWKRLKNKTVARNPLFETQMHRVKLPNGKIIEDYLHIKAKNGAMIIPITENNEIVFIRQYKYAINKTILTLPGGLADEKENLTKTAKRELLEETGYSAKALKKLGHFYPLPGNITQKTDVFLATGCKKIQNQTSPDETEFIKVKLFPLKALPNFIKNNEINDSMSLAALTFFTNSIKNNPYVK